MSRAQRSKRVRPPRPLYEYPCTHCGDGRLVYPLHEFVTFNRSHPLPGLRAALDDLVRLYGGKQEASICPGCFCLTTDLTASHRD